MYVCVQADKATLLMPASSCSRVSKLEAASYRRRSLTCLRPHSLNMWDPADPAGEAEGVAPRQAWRRIGPLR